MDVQREPETATETRRVTTTQDSRPTTPPSGSTTPRLCHQWGGVCGVCGPVYHGYERGTHERYRGRDWAALEADARREWEARHPSTWERFKDAIRYGWENVHARTSG